MSKKKELLALSVVIITIIVVWGGGSEFAHNPNTTKPILDENVEALTDGEVSGGYSSTHIKCYDVVYYKGTSQTIENGKYQGISWANPNSNKPMHQHSCSYCNTIP